MKWHSLSKGRPSRTGKLFQWAAWQVMLCQCCKKHNDKGGDCDQNSAENHDETQLPTPTEFEEDDDRIVAQSHDGYLTELLQGMES